VIALPAHQLVYADEVGQAHLRLRFKSGDGAIVNGIAFARSAEARPRADAKPRPALHVAGSLAVDRFRVRSACNSAWLDVAVPDPGPALIR
jgi:single-stranded-DNA-specific exonuclease